MARSIAADTAAVVSIKAAYAIGLIWTSGILSHVAGLMPGYRGVEQRLTPSAGPLF